MKTSKINKSIFIEEWNKVMSKLEQINDIEKLGGSGEEHTKLSVDDSGLCYHSETFYSGCGTEWYDFEVSWEEINEPIEYFEKKYKDELVEHKKKERLKIERKHKQEVARELETLKKLKEKYEN